MNLLISVNNVRFTTTRVADDASDRLKDRLGLRGRNAVARLAIAKSLSLGTPAPEISHAEDDESGGAIKGETLFGADLSIWVALLVQSAGLQQPTPKDIEQLVRRHWRRGVTLLTQDLEDDDVGNERFLTRLAGGATGAGRKTQSIDTVRQVGVSTGPISLSLGHPADGDEDDCVSWTLNGLGWAPHVAIMGGAGSGKTRTAREMWRELRDQVGPGLGMVIIDPKGDLGSNRELVAALGATVIRVQKEPVPLDVLKLSSGADTLDAAIRFGESLVRSTTNPLGQVQSVRLQDAVKRSLDGKAPHTLAKILNQLQQVYATQSMKDDSLIASMRQLTGWTLFEPTHSPEEFFSRTWILSLNEANETVARLVAGLVTDALYNWMRPAPDAPVDASGYRGVRVVFAVDEAHHLLGKKQQSLGKLLKEGRSKGVSVMLMSQSPTDFDGKDCNYLENIGLCLCFRTNVPATATLKTMWQAKVDTGGLERGVAVTRLPGEQSVRRLVVWE